VILNLESYLPGIARLCAIKMQIKTTKRKYIPQLLKLAGLKNDFAHEYIATEITKQLHALDYQNFCIQYCKSTCREKMDCSYFHVGPPFCWDINTTIDAPDLTCQLKTVLGMQRDECPKVVLCHDHGTGDLLQYANLTARDNVMLDAITRKEYDMLNPYL
jgi:hypothetical protein